jgi:hypothetical protein
MPEVEIRSLWLVRERRKKPVRLVQDDANLVTVRIITATRDPKTNRITYATFDSFGVAEAKPEEVFATCKEAILRAPAKK